MKLRFIKLSPTQNMTVIVEEPVPRSEHRSVAAALMDYAGVYAEQVGFRENPTLPGAGARLQMMGGEFCGNATMCMAACLAREGGMQPGERRSVPVEVSGASGVLMCEVECTDRAYICRVDMPLPESIESRSDYTLVRLPGIAHAVVECAAPERLRSGAEQRLRAIAAEVSGDAVGLMLYAPEISRLLPLVYVRDTDSMVWERGCGSGSAAVGAYIAWKNRRSMTAGLLQPGGIIETAAEWNDGVTRLAITGRVTVACEGTAYI